MKTNEEKLCKSPSRVENVGTHHELPEILATNPGRKMIKATARPSRPPTVIRLKRVPDLTITQKKTADSSNADSNSGVASHNRRNTEKWVALTDFSTLPHNLESPPPDGRGEATEGSQASGKNTSVIPSISVKMSVDVLATSTDDTQRENGESSINKTDRGKSPSLKDSHTDDVRSVDDLPIKKDDHAKSCYGAKHADKLKAEVNQDGRGIFKGIFRHRKLYKENTNTLLDLIHTYPLLSKEEQALLPNMAEVTSAIEILSKFRSDCLSIYISKRPQESMNLKGNSEDNPEQSKEERAVSKQGCTHSNCDAVNLGSRQTDKQVQNSSFLSTKGQECDQLCQQSRYTDIMYNSPDGDPKGTEEHDTAVTPLIVPGSVKVITLFPPPSCENTYVFESGRDNNTIPLMESFDMSPTVIKVEETKSKCIETLTRLSTDCGSLKRDGSHSVVKDNVMMKERRSSKRDSVVDVKEKVLEKDVKNKMYRQKEGDDLNTTERRRVSQKPSEGGKAGRRQVTADSLRLKASSGRTISSNQEGNTYQSIKGRKWTGGEFHDQDNKTNVIERSSPSPELQEDRCKRKQGCDRSKIAYFKSLKERIKRDSKPETKARDTSHIRESTALSECSLPNRSSIKSDENSNDNEQPKSLKTKRNASFLQNKHERTVIDKTSHVNGENSKYRPEYIKAVAKYRTILRKKMGLLGNQQINSDQCCYKAMGKPDKQKKDEPSSIRCKKSNDGKQRLNHQIEPCTKPLTKGGGDTTLRHDSKLRKNAKTMDKVVKREPPSSTPNKPDVTLRSDIRLVKAEEDMKGKPVYAKSKVAIDMRKHRQDQSQYSPSDTKKVDEWIFSPHSFSPMTYWRNQNEKMKVSLRMAATDSMKLTKYATINRSIDEEESSPSNSTDEDSEYNDMDDVHSINGEYQLDSLKLTKSSNCRDIKDKAGDVNPTGHTDDQKVPEIKLSNTSGKQKKSVHVSHLAKNTEHQKGRQTRASLSARIWDELVNESMTSTHSVSDSGSYVKTSSHKPRHFNYKTECVDGARERASQTWQSALADVDKLRDTKNDSSSDQSITIQRQRKEKKRKFGRHPKRQESVQKSDNESNSSLHLNRNKEFDTSKRNNNCSKLKNKSKQHLEEQPPIVDKDEITKVAGRENKTKECFALSTFGIGGDGENGKNGGRCGITSSSNQMKGDHENCNESLTPNASTIQGPAYTTAEKQICDRYKTSSLSGAEEDDYITTRNDVKSDESSDWVSFDRTESPQDIFDFSCNLTGTSYYGRCISFQSKSELSENLENKDRELSKSPIQQSTSSNIGCESFKTDNPCSSEKCIYGDDDWTEDIKSNGPIPTKKDDEPDEKGCSNTKNITRDKCQLQSRYRVITEEGEAAWVPVEDLAFLSFM